MERKIPTPWNFLYLFFSFDSLQPLQLLQVLNDVFAEINPQVCICHHCNIWLGKNVCWADFTDNLPTWCSKCRIIINILLIIYCYICFNSTNLIFVMKTLSKWRKGCSHFWESWNSSQKQSLEACKWCNLDWCLYLFEIINHNNNK